MEIRYSHHAFLLFLVCCTIFKTISGTDEDICGSINDNVNVETEFDFPARFKAHVETVLPDEGRILGSSMAFAEDAKMLKINLEAKDYSKALYHDYENGQTLAYDFLAQDRGSCLVDPSMAERWGFYLVPNPPANDQIDFKATDILRLSGKSGFGDSNIALQKDNQKLKYRNLAVTRYISCQKIVAADGSELVAKVTHLVSRTKLTRSESGTVPVQIIFDGKFSAGPRSGDSIKHTFNFFHYTTDFTNEVFESPVGIICQGRKGSQEFPEQPLHISFGQEIHSSDPKVKMLTLKTVYDYELRYVTELIFNPEPTKLDAIRLDDFYSGLSFTIDPNEKACDVEDITKTFKVNDFVEHDGQIRMMSPEQFFDHDHVQYYYNGKKHFRGLETEAWIGKDPDTGHIYEWYFALGIRHSVNDYARAPKNSTYRIPYKRILWPSDSKVFYSSYYFQVDFTKPSNRMDLTPCFNGQFKPVSIYVPGLRLDQLVKEEDIILQRAMKSLTDALNVRFTRIANLQIEFYGDDGYLTFNLAEKFRHADNIAKTAEEPSLEEAYQTLKDKLQSEELLFITGKDDFYITSVGKMKDVQIRTPSEGSSGYSGGAMAGLAIAMILIGLAGGGGGGYWFFIRHA